MASRLGLRDSRLSPRGLGSSTALLVAPPVTPRGEVLHGAAWPGRPGPAVHLAV